MTATVIPFPTKLDRDDLEFLRTGSSNYLRAIDEANAIWAGMEQSGQAAPIERLAALSRQIDLLAAYRPEDVRDLVLLGSMSVELRMAPRLLTAMASRRASA